MRLIPSFIIASSLLLPGVAGAAKMEKGDMLDAIKVIDVTLKKRAGNMEVGYQFDLSSMKLGSNQRIIFTPVLVGEGDSIAFDPVVVNGRNAQIKYDREKKQRVPGAAQVLQAGKGGNLVWSGTSTLPYQSWMDLSYLTIKEDLCGCGDLQDQASLMVGVPFDNRPAPMAEITYLQPNVEATKARAEEGSAFVDFMVNKTNILPDYRQNRKELAKITGTIDLVKNDPLVSITEINIHGYASPEGKYDANKRLAEGRAESLKNYVKSLYTLPDRIFTSSATPEDWVGLRRLVENSDIADKTAILEVIDSNMDPDAKDLALRQRFPKSYAIMLKEMYPALRHTDYTVKYVVRPLTLEETIEVMRKNPKNASLQEMFLVAQSYEPGSDEFNEAMAIAVSTYPDDPVANLNAGLVALNADQLDKADNYLRKAGDSGEAKQARGILAMKRGSFDEAQRLFEEAKALGVASADFNLEVLARKRKLAQQNEE
ncbi:MAG: DUF3868 domain-containing protein [Muribaculaceae bacterium]|nr:DUF3868 domain-containing protein [Muribaculaceae bacterium]